jgi:hypothetical protein
MHDRLGIPFVEGDIIDINQTVNGQRFFVLLKWKPYYSGEGRLGEGIRYDIRYLSNLERKYEYNNFELLETRYDDGPIIIGSLGDTSRTIINNFKKQHDGNDIYQIFRGVF